MMKIFQLSLLIIFVFSALPVSASDENFPIYTYRALVVNYNDPWFTLDETKTDKQWGVAKSKFPESWSRITGSSDVVVAVVDTGIDATHEDLRNSNILAGFDTLNNKPIPAGVNSDDNSHGTLVAGVISAEPNNGKGIAGVAFGVSILPVKALDKDGNGTSETVSEGIIWAVDQGADVINLSLGGIGFSHDTLLSRAIDYAYKKGAVVVSAAGNDAAVTGGSLDVDPVFPICNDNGENMVLGVTALDFRDLKPQFANFGKSCVDVSAPGRRIISTINFDPVTGAPSPDSYAYASGTSLAVPFVSGQVALLKSLYKNATPRQIMDRITATARNVDRLNLSECAGFPCTGLIGSGAIDVEKSLTQPIVPKLSEGDLAVGEDGKLYAIWGGKRRVVTDFVFRQRFSGKTPIPVNLADLVIFSEGPPLEPLDGTLIKKPEDQTIFYMEKGVKLPVTYQIFLSRGFSFSSVRELPAEDLNAWITGSFLPPKEGTLVKGSGPTVFWTVGGSLHPVNYRFWKEVGLSVFPIMRVSDQDLRSFPKGAAFIR